MKTVGSSMRIWFLLFTSFLSFPIYSQDIINDSSETYIYDEMYNEEIADDFTFESNLNCDTNNLKIIDIQFQNCREITDKNILPSEIYIGRDLIKERISRFQRVDDTLYPDFIYKLQCCPKVSILVNCSIPGILNIHLSDISLEECMCICPFYFRCKILDSDGMIEKFLINETNLEITNEIFENALITKDRNIFTGITTVKYYKDYIHNSTLIQEKRLNRKNEIISNNYFFSGREINEY